MGFDASDKDRPALKTDWQSVAAERGIEVGIMREALEAIAGATWWDGKSHNERIAELQQIASDALRDAK